MVAPTIQWVPEMGSLRKEATSCHTAEPGEKLIMLVQQAFLTVMITTLYYYTSGQPLGNSTTPLRGPICPAFHGYVMFRLSNVKSCSQSHCTPCYVCLL